MPQTPPLHLAAWPWPLKIRTLGSFELIRDDEPVVLAGKVKKPVELLKALVALGGKNVSQERLTDALWPDADGDLAQRSFDTTLHRLRKLLGNEKILQLQAGKLSINPSYCWIDAWAFVRQCGEVEDALDLNGQAMDRGKMDLSFEKCFERGVALYKGGFLPEDSGHAWTIFLREQLRGRFLHLLKRAGGYCEALKQWEKAAAWYLKGLEENPLAEEFHQRLMVCYRQQGPVEQAMKTPLNFRPTLSTKSDLLLHRRRKNVVK